MQDLMPTPPTSPDHRGLTFGLLISLTFHAMLLSLAFGGQGRGLTGLGLPWQDRRTEVPDLHVVLLPTPVPTVEPSLNTGVEQPHDVEPTTTLVRVMSPPKMLTAASVAQPDTENAAKAMTISASPSAAAISPLPAERPNEARAPLPQPTKDLIAVAKSSKPTWAVPPAPEVAASVAAVEIPPLLDIAEAKQDAHRQAEQLEAARQETAKQAMKQQDEARQEAARIEAARVEAARVEAARIETARLEAVRQELAKQVAARLAAARQEASRQDVARADAAKVEAERQEIAKQTATQQEAARQEAARVEAARIETARQELAKQTAARQAAARQEATREEVVRAEAARVEAERQEIAKQAATQAAARQEAVRQEVARAEAARVESARQVSAQQEAARQAAIQIEATRLAALQAEAEKRQEKLLAIGRQLNEEANRRKAAEAQRQLPSASGARRGRLFGRTDPNPELILYAEAWSRKIQMNMTFDMVREAAKQPHTDPMVTVAVRSDGSVESISFVVSSGVPAIDDAIRRIVTSQANYQAFPPGLLKDYDVIEIRRTWYFDVAIRLY